MSAVKLTFSRYRQMRLVNESYINCINAIILIKLKGSKIIYPLFDEPRPKI